MANVLRKAPLTQALVYKLNLDDYAPAGSKDHIVWDEEMPSFGVRLRPSKSSYVVQYRVGRQQRRESLGDVRKLSLKDARKAGAQRFAKVELGVDPAAERAEARGADRTKFGNIVEHYLTAKKPDLRPNTWKAAKRYLEIYWRPLHGRAIAEITPKIVAPLLKILIEKHGRTAAARARGNLSALFVWAIKEQLVGINPTVGTNDPGEGIPPRDRVLNDDEIRIIWRACRDDDFGRIVKLLLLTACRRDEIGGLAWSEIDFGAERITLPGARTKSRRAHILPLPRLAVDTLREVSRKEEREFLFGVSGGSFSRWSLEKLRMDKRIIEAGATVLPWTLHDLRRTAATRMAELGAQPHVIEAVLNHSYGSQVARTYNRHSYEAEKRAALSAWADRLAGIVNGAQVIPFGRTA